jgi:hypothetical protein
VLERIPSPLGSVQVTRLDELEAKAAVPVDVVDVPELLSAATTRHVTGESTW